MTAASIIAARMAPKESDSRSCHNCNRKKVKCDKQEPCGACVRTRVKCSFPPSGARVRRSKRTIIAEMSSRISSLEAALARTTAEPTVAHPDSVTTEYVATDATRAAQSANIPQPDGIDGKCRSNVVIQTGSSKQYFDEVLLSRVLGEVSFTSITPMVMAMSADLLTMDAGQQCPACPYDIGG